MAYQALQGALNTIAGTSNLATDAAANAAISRIGAIEANGGSNLLTAGQTSYPRRFGINGQTTGASQTLLLTHFTAGRSETISTIAFITSSVNAGATPTLVRYGLYSEATDGALTLVASTANDTTLLASTNTKYPKSLSASYPVVVGQRYAVGILVVTAAAYPNYMGVLLGSTTAANTECNIAPRLCSAVTGQADLPSPISNATLATSTARIPLYATLT